MPTTLCPIGERLPTRRPRWCQETAVTMRGMLGRRCSGWWQETIIIQPISFKTGCPEADRNADDDCLSRMNRELASLSALRRGFRRAGLRWNFSPLCQVLVLRVTRTHD